MNLPLLNCKIHFLKGRKLHVVTGQAPGLDYLIGCRTRTSFVIDHASTIGAGDQRGTVTPVTWVMTDVITTETRVGEKSMTARLRVVSLGGVQRPEQGSHRAQRRFCPRTTRALTASTPASQVPWLGMDRRERKD